jgi:hypothetical protein
MKETKAMAKKRSRQQPQDNATTDILETMKAELAEGAELLRQHYPDEDEQQLLAHALYWRKWHYQHGRRPTDQEIIDMKTKAEAEAKLYADAARRAKARADADAQAAVNPDMELVE